MINKDFFYYKNTIILKFIAIILGLLDKLQLLKYYKKKQFHNNTTIYQKYLAKNISINANFSTLYITYEYFNAIEYYEQHLHFQDDIAIMRNDLSPKLNPIITAMYALTAYNDYIKHNNIDSLNKFWKQCHFLATHGKADEKGFIFYADVANNTFGVKVPWYSGITQSIIASVFMRAFHISKNDKWKVLAFNTLKSNLVPISEAGVFSYIDNGFCWVEEYPSRIPPLVLNGFCFSLIAFAEYEFFIEKNKIFNDMLQKCTQTLFYTLHHYERFSYLKYDRKRFTLENIEYDGLMVFIFFHLYELTNNKGFSIIAQRLSSKTNWKAFFSFYKISYSQYLIKIIK